MGKLLSLLVVANDSWYLNPGYGWSSDIKDAMLFPNAAEAKKAADQMMLVPEYAADTIRAYKNFGQSDQETL